MGRSCFLRFLLLLFLLVLCCSHGFGRQAMATVEFGDSSVQVVEVEENSREMMEVLDYQLDPGPNTNPKTGVLVPPPRG